MAGEASRRRVPFAIHWSHNYQQLGLDAGFAGPTVGRSAPLASRRFVSRYARLVGPMVGRSADLRVGQSPIHGNAQMKTWPLAHRLTNRPVDRPTGQRTDRPMAPRAVRHMYM